jgi:hypothetical protein
VAQDGTLDPQTGSSNDPIDALRACARQVSIASAQLLAAIVAVADRAKPGFDADEVAFALAWTQTYARSQVAFGRYLTRTLPAVFAALAAGELDLRRAWVFADALAVVDDPVATAITDRLLPEADTLTTSQLRDRLRRAVLKTDPDAKRRITRTIDGRYVACTPDGEGSASLAGVRLPAARAVAAFERVDAYARSRKTNGDDRSLDQLRADTFLDLLDGTGLATAPMHRAGVIELTVDWSTATGATNNPATLAGYGPVDADTARDLITAQLAAYGADRRGPSGRRDRPLTRWRQTITGPDGSLTHTRTMPIPAATRAPVARPAAARPPVEADSTRRDPSAALARWIKTRDRTCRAPGCRVPARTADIDHTTDHAAGGPTSHDNLAVLCRHHHRLKHEGVWHATQPAPGRLVWTSPTGHTYTRDPDPP